MKLINRDRYTGLVTFDNQSEQMRAIAEKVANNLPAIDKQTTIFDRGNSQTTLSMQTVTLLGGQSPMRMLRQCLAEIEKRKMSLAEAQFNLAKKKRKLERVEKKLQDRPDDEVLIADMLLCQHTVSMLENKMNGALKDIAVLLDTYEKIQKQNNIEGWDEADFEKEEAKSHIRRGFELLYRNLMEMGRVKEATLEYLQQYGVHPQMALREVRGYIQVIEDEITEGRRELSADSLENFLDNMVDKYYKDADKASKRLYGDDGHLNYDYMLQNKKED